MDYNSIIADTYQEYNLLWWYTIIALTVPLLLSYYLATIICKKKRIKGFRKFSVFALLSLISVTLVTLAYLLPYAKAEDEALEALKSEGTLEYTESDTYYAFRNKGSDCALIVYPGARIDEKAYSVLAKSIAQSGIDVYVIKAPFHIALFCIKAPDKIISENDYKQVYISGHSLGGAVASIYASGKEDKIEGIIMLASYPSKDLNGNIRFLSIYDDKDGLLDKKAYEEKKESWPLENSEYVIKGGNHSGYAFYGKQKGDNEADISKKEQIEITSEQIAEFIK